MVTMWNDRCLRTVLLVIAFMILGGGLKVQLLNARSQSFLEEERFGALKTFAEPEFDIVIMGDSRAYWGISPDGINTVLPDYQILNFGYDQGGLNETMFHEAFSKKKPPKRP